MMTGQTLRSLAKTQKSISCSGIAFPGAGARTPLFERGFPGGLVVYDTLVRVNLSGPYVLGGSPQTPNVLEVVLVPVSVAASTEMVTVAVGPAQAVIGPGRGHQPNWASGSRTDNCA